MWGGDKQNTDIHTNIAGTRLNWPLGRISANNNLYLTTRHDRYIYLVYSHCCDLLSEDLFVSFSKDRLKLIYTLYLYFNFIVVYLDFVVFWDKHAMFFLSPLFRMTMSSLTCCRGQFQTVRNYSTSGRQLDRQLIWSRMS